MQTVTEDNMQFISFDCGSIPVVANISRFQGASGVEEYHITVQPTEYAPVESQLEWVFRAYRAAVESVGLHAETAVLRRFSCSDLSNQAMALEGYPFSNPNNTDDPCAISWVRQPPAPPAKVALWAYHIKDPSGRLEKIQEGTSLSLNRGSLTHHWTMGLTCLNTAGSHDQTRVLLGKYDAFLRERGMTLADNVLRTWFFVQNIDTNYQGFVVARREFFAERGLTAETHYIASTGIEGTHRDLAAKVIMDAYAIAGVGAEQIQYLAAPDHLSPTHIYGVTFERGTAVSYADRKHIMISGTASIDHQGRILHPGDVALQLDRTLENVEALLQNAGGTLSDMAVFLVYVRDVSDHEIVTRKMRERFPETPIQVVVAPVCRPGWLVEIEGKAIITANQAELPAF